MPRRVPVLVTLFFVSHLYTTNSDRTSFVDDVDPIVSRICNSLRSVPDTTDGRLIALNNALGSIDAAGSDFQHDMRTETFVLRGLPSWTLFIQSIQRLEYLLDQLAYYKQSFVSKREKQQFADVLLDFGTDGLPNVLHVIHSAVVGSSVTATRSIYAVFSDRRKSVSSNYLADTMRFVKDMLNLQTYGHTAGIWACMNRNNSSCYDRFTSLLTDRLVEQDLYLSRKRVYSFSAPAVQTSYRWCSCSTCKPLLGDFNGDGRADILCLKREGSSRLTTFNAAAGSFRDQNSRWFQTESGCHGSNVHVGFLNSDRRSDVLCLKPSDRHNKMRMLYATHSGHLHSSAGWKGNHGIVTRCLGDQRHSKIFTGDFNGDGETDIMCQNGNSGRMAITHMPTNHILNSWRWVVPWCRTSSTELFVGDFNGDRRDDLLCLDWQTGGASIKLANSRGIFVSSYSWRGLQNFCRRSSQRTLYVGDFNGDRKSDLLCYTFNRNTRDNIKIAYANGDGHFQNSQVLSLAIDWCSSSNVLIRDVADVNGDGRADLVCYDRNLQMRVALSDLYLNL